MLSFLQSVLAALGLTASAVALAPLASGHDANAHPMHVPGALHCAIEVSQRASMLTIEPSIRAEETGTGSYRLSLSGRGPSGTTNVSQGSTVDFEAGETTRLGKLMLDAHASYEVRLDVETDWDTATCNETITPL